MSGPPCGELNRYLDEVRERRKAGAEQERKARELTDFMGLGLCMAVQDQFTPCDGCKPLQWCLNRSVCLFAKYGLYTDMKFERDTW